VTILPDGRPASVDRSGEIRIWPKDDIEIVTLDMSRRPTGPKVIREASAVVLRGADGHVMKTFAAGPRERVLFYKLSPSGRFVQVFLSSAPQQLRSRSIVWDLQQNREVARATGRNLDPVHFGLCYSADERRAAAITAPHGAQVWSTEDGSLLGTLRVQGRRTIVLSPTGKYLAAAGTDKVTIWNVAEASKQSEIQVPDVAPTAGPKFAFADDERHLIVEGIPDTLWDIATAAQVPATPRLLADMTASLRHGCRRLYQVQNDRISICCARTLRPLLTFRFRAAARALSMPAPPFLPGASGYARFDELDRCLDEQSAKWDSHSDPRPGAWPPTVAEMQSL
jgi:hypothetical protein